MALRNGILTSSHQSTAHLVWIPKRVSMTGGASSPDYSHFIDAIRGGLGGQLPQPLAEELYRIALRD